MDSARKSLGTKVAKIDLSSLNLTELVQLQKNVGKAIVDYEARKRAQALKAAEAAAKEHGFSLDALMGKGSAKPVSAPRYRHPENPALTWTGKGPQPKWLKEQLAAGKSKDNFAI